MLVVWHCDSLQPLLKGLWLVLQGPQDHEPWNFLQGGVDTKANKKIIEKQGYIFLQVWGIVQGDPYFPSPLTNRACARQHFVTHNIDLAETLAYLSARGQKTQEA